MMASETVNEKHSIKNLLFTKAIPNHVITFPIAGYKVYPCIDCGDRFIFESSYDYHVNRKSVKISYMCRHCSQFKTFYNRCNLLSHIRSHSFRTATINVYDLRVEPLPLNHFSYKHISTNNISKSPKAPHTLGRGLNANSVCFECKKNIATNHGMVFKDRQKHFMEYTNELYSCPICLFTLPTICGLKAHIRLHLKCPPYFCPECGIQLSKSMSYPYNHDCEGFKMMRATARLKCPIPDCHIFHPNEYKEHIKQKHLNKVFKCPFCVVACFNEHTMDRHLKGHKTDNRASIFYQCELCPGKLVLQYHMDTHLKGHTNTVPVFPCWTCGAILKGATALIEHHILHHVQTARIKDMFQSILSYAETNTCTAKKIYRVVKKCEQCKRCFTYKCEYNEIQDIPNECPYKCTKDLQVSIVGERSETDSNIDQYIKCNLCQTSISQDWEVIKNHFSLYHKEHKCLDAKVVLQRFDGDRHIRPKKQNRNKVKVKRLKKQTASKPQNKIFVPVHSTSQVVLQTTIDNHTNQYICKKCGHGSENKELLEIHMVVHRDPCMAYQCMECGESFVVKPSFSKHLLLEHDIEATDQYITTKNCYNEDALVKSQFNGNNGEDLPLNENQCRICRDQFDNLEDLEKHFRVHGMAFLLQNTSNKTSTPP